jgi:hypothetical protein
MIDVPQGMFDVFALSLPAGHAFRDDIPKGAWHSPDALTLGAITVNAQNRTFGVLIMRRREDDVWVVIERRSGFPSEDEAQAVLRSSVVDGPRERIPPGIQRRPSLGDLNGVTPSNVFLSLGRPTHHIALWMLNQLYLAMPNPDANWASDCQTGNFHTRLWEAVLLACFREQGLLVTQDYPSPDFRISNRHGGAAWIEAVTANPPTPYDHYNTKPSEPPDDRKERLVGAAAVRFAKTIRNKLDKRYDLLPHVAGAPFAIALADFQSPGSMTWSRGALPSYLYGIAATVTERDGSKVASSDDVKVLLGEQEIPAGLFRSADHSELSAVLFSHACSISKLNRVGVSAGADRNGYWYVRYGTFFDRTPGALESIPFCMDITSKEYRSLWPPYTYEPWSAELEVFHNPLAKHPIPDTLLPESTHWRMINGEVVCSAFYEKSILSSQTLVMDESTPMPTLQQLMRAVAPEDL